MGYYVQSFKCGCTVTRADNRFAKIELSLGLQCPTAQEDPNHTPRLTAIRWAKERDERNAAIVAKAKATRA